MSSPKKRCTMVNRTAKEAGGLLSEHVKAADATPLAMLYHEKTDRNKGPSWPQLWQHRHMLGDLVALTRGNLLKLKLWEIQVGKFCEKIGVKMSTDECALVAVRPRIMLSHLRHIRKTLFKGLGGIPKHTRRSARS